MSSDIIFDAAVIGGGPAGSSAALQLARAGFNVCIIEKKAFPRETLCGEFISREAADMLTSMGLFDKFKKLCPNPINSFRFIFKNGKALKVQLSFTGYGLRRGTFDNFLFKQAIKGGVKAFQPSEVKEIKRLNKSYLLTVLTSEGKRSLEAGNVIAAYGKQSSMDRKLGRRFAGIKSRLNGVKLHLPKEYAPDFPEHEIHIYQGDGIYCGLNMVDEGILTVCFLEDRNSFEGSPKTHLKDLIIKNGSLKDIFTSDIFNIIDKAPVYGTGNIYFGKRNLVEDGIFMAGDTAQVIAPLAGDGIAMAIQSAGLASDAVIKKLRGELTGPQAEEYYAANWKKLFSRRLRNAYFIQKAVLKPALAAPSYIAGKMFPGIVKYLINSTRG